MTVLIICPDYISHYLPLLALGENWKEKGEDIIFATGPFLAQKIKKDGFKHIKLILGEGGNPKLLHLDEQPSKEKNRVSSCIDATRLGMVPALHYQAQNRLHDIFWKPLEITKKIQKIVDKVKPKFVINVQLSYNSTAALLALEIPFASYVTGHPAQVPTNNELYGYPYHYPSRFHPTKEELKNLENVCTRVQTKFTKEFNKLITKINPNLAPVKNGLAVTSPELILYNYPEELALYRKKVNPEYAHFIGASVRQEILPKDLENWLSSTNSDLPTIYISLGSVLSERSDVLEKIIKSVSTEPFRVILSSGVMNLNKVNKLPKNWLVRSFLPQVALLKYCDLVVCHGGNNTVTESLYNGVPLLIGPFCSDQFYGAADIERCELGSVFDPNDSTPEEIRELIYSSLKTRNRAKELGEKLRSDPGPEKAYKLCQQTFNF
ncbi:MAG: nucleotide disphospho-sugar-binding domain-containing protein [Candidatus Heimdallarchaeaceae archaeon]